MSTETAAKAPAAEKVAQPKMYRLEPGRWHQAEFKRRHFYVEAEQGVTLEILQDPSYWANFGREMTPWSIIEVHTDDGTLWAELLVLACGRAWANVHVLRSAHLTIADVEQTQAPSQVTHKYQWKGQAKMHCIVRSDGEIVHEGSQTKAEAVAWAVANKVELTT